MIFILTEVLLDFDPRFSITKMPIGDLMRVVGWKVAVGGETADEGTVWRHESPAEQ